MVRVKTTFVGKEVLFVVVNVSRLELLLAERGMNKTALSCAAGVSRQTISAILKKGECQPVTAAKLARGLGVPVDEITFRLEVVCR